MPIVGVLTSARCMCVCVAVVDVGGPASHCMLCVLLEKDYVASKLNA